jgi:hypothetical protein
MIFLQVIPTAAEDQLLLVELISAVKVLPADTLIQTVKQVIRNPPTTASEKVNFIQKFLQPF